MKKLFALLLLAVPSYAGLITHNDYTSGATITASGQNANENAIVNEFNGNIDNTNIKALGITGANVAANTITVDKLSTVLQSSITAMAVTSGANNVFYDTNTFHGPVLISSGLSANGSYGTTNQVLISNGPNNSPSWRGSTSIGAFQFISSATANNSASINFTGLNANSTIQSYLLVLDGLTTGTNSDTFQIRISTTAGSFISAAYNYTIITANPSGIGQNGSNSASVWDLTNPSTVLSFATNGLGGTINIIGASEKFKTFTSHVNYVDTGGNVRTDLSSGGNNVTEKIVGISLFYGTGPINAGSVHLYGLYSTTYP